MRKHMETLTGKGKLLQGEQEIDIRYQIDVFQDWTDTSTRSGKSSVPGLKSIEITGEVSEFLDINATYTLVLKDGRRCQVFVQSMSLPSPMVRLMAMNAAELFEGEPNS